ncbi:MAG TPA: Ig-like domain-containing protein [Burkholderiaceae bacterium]|nr:Ig-like domain-containing protein [Burkholderiaceae bacterium]
MTPSNRTTRPWHVGLLAAALAAAVPAHASHIGDDLASDQQTVAATDQMLNALRQWENAPAAVRDARLAALVQRTAERKERLLRLIERNPQVAAARLMPAALRERLPAAARVHVEEPVSLAGTVFAEVASDVSRGFARQRLLMAAGGVRYDLAVGDATARERDALAWAGRRVTMNAARIDRQLLVSRKADVQVVALDTSLMSAGATTPTTAPVVTGDQKTLVILANFSDKALTCNAADVTSRVFGATGGTVNNGFKESSRGVVSFSGVVAGPFPIPYTSTGACDYSGWGSAAEAAAKAAGFDPAQYRRVNIVTPSNGTCGWSGLAYMPGTRSWVQSCGATGVYTHELGHNLALHHAASPTSEYGDGSDPMGGARTVRNHGANQVMAGWVPTGGLLDVGSSGTFTIAALGPEAGTQPQVLRLTKLDTNEKYYVSLRTAQGVDASLSAAYLNTVSVHLASGTLPARTTVLANLAGGQSWTDSVNGITVTNQGVAGASATVAVAMSGATCARSAPAVVFSPASQTSTPGAAVSYSVAVTNNNSAACGSASFALASVLPAGVTGSLSPASLALNPAASANATLTVSSDSTTTASFGLDVSASESGTANSATGHGTLNLAFDSAPPSVAFASPTANATLSGGRITLSATASDDIGVARVEFYDGAKLIGSDASAPYSVTWNLRKTAKGAHTLRARAVDGAGNAAEASVAVTVQ